jgi:DNA repair protein RecN (Recombination protein N)
MLRHLQIRDFAIIEATELEFTPGLTVLTGETGAGKSIMVDALEFLAGGRAGSDCIRAGAERADVSATLDASGVAGDLRHLLDEQAIEAGGEIVLRRSLGSDGRSRNWINGQSVPLQVLRNVAALLIDIHGQHEFQSLLRPSVQRQLLDNFGQHTSLVSEVHAAHSFWVALVDRAVKLESAARDRDARLDLLRFQVQELAALQLKEGEFAALHADRDRASHHGKLLEAARQASELLYDAEGGNAHALLARAQSALRPVAGVDARLAALLPLLDESAVRIKEAAQSLAHYLDALDLDPARTDQIERRLAAVEELARKHRVAPEALIARHLTLVAELEELENSAANLGAVQAQLKAARATYQERARALTVARDGAARRLAKAISTRMQELGMAGGRFFVAVEPSPDAEPAAHGADRIEFRVTTNPGQPQRALAKVASGGELSRLSLAVQVSCLKDRAPCMIFDEVDAGIGGRVAEIVGRELRALASDAQVLCVTHLPQVAAQGHQHLRVSKLTDGKSTRTAVTSMHGDSRIEEIARMLGGIDITDRARAHAAEMLAAAGNPQSGNARTSPKRGP